MSKKFKGPYIIWQHKVVEYLAYSSVFLIPLYVGFNHFSLFNSPKIMIMLGVSLLMTIFFLWGKWKENEFKIKFSLLSVVLLLFVLIMTISSLLGIDPINSFFGWDNVMPLVCMYSLAVFALILGLLIKENRKIITNLLFVSLLTGVTTVIVLYIALFEGSKYIMEGSTLGNSSYLGCYLLFNFFFGLALFLYQNKLWKKIFIALASFFILINPVFVNKDFLLGKISLSELLSHPLSLLGMANGAAMGIFASLVFISLLFLISSRRKVLKILGVSFLCIFVLGIFFVGKELVTPDTSLNKLYTEEKSGNRFLAWSIAEKGFKENHILGNGFNNYIYTFDKHYNPDIYKKDDYIVERFTNPHNVFWEFSSNTGVLGVTSYLCLLFVLFMVLYKSKDENKNLNNARIVLSGLLFGYFIQNLFVFDTINTYLMLFILIAIGIGVEDVYEWKLDKKFVFLKKIFIILVILFSIYLIYPLVIAPWNNSKDMNKIMIETKNIGNFVKIRENLDKKSFFGGIMDDTFQATKLFKIYQKIFYKIDNKNKEFFIKELDSIVFQLENDIKREPYYSNSYLLVSRMLNLRLLTEIKDNDYIKIDGKNYNKEVWQKSYDSLMKAIELNPNNPDTYLVLSQLYMIKGDFDTARLYSKRSINMTPEYREVYEYAYNLLKISPNKDFENYIKENEIGVQHLSEK